MEWSKLFLSNQKIIIVIFILRTWERSYFISIVVNISKLLMMMGRVLEMQGTASIYCVILITALDAQVGLLLVVRGEIFFN
jgi:hypothetical protein